MKNPKSLQKLDLPIDFQVEINIKAVVQAFAIT